MLPRVGEAIVIRPEYTYPILPVGQSCAFARSTDQAAGPFLDLDLAIVTTGPDQYLDDV
ncbi:MAG: hypothetical protein ACRCSN_15955 [Dermatophilaceae bacterium]